MLGFVGDVINAEPFGHDTKNTDRRRREIDFMSDEMVLYYGTVYNMDEAAEFAFDQRIQ